MFNRLKEHSLRNGGNPHVRRPNLQNFDDFKVYWEERRLWKWADNQRTLFNKSGTALAPHRRDLLISIGYGRKAFQAKKKNTDDADERFQIMLEWLNAFAEEYRHCRVPSTGPTESLYHRIRRQQSAYELGTLSEERFNKLNKVVGFVWQLKKRKRVELSPAASSQTLDTAALPQHTVISEATNTSAAGDSSIAEPLEPRQSKRRRRTALTEGEEMTNEEINNMTSPVPLPASNPNPTKESDSNEESSTDDHDGSAPAEYDDQSYDGDTSFPPFGEDNSRISEHSTKAEEEHSSTMSNQQEATIEPPEDVGQDANEEGIADTQGSAWSFLTKGISMVRGLISSPSAKSEKGRNSSSDEEEASRTRQTPRRHVSGKEGSSTDDQDGPSPAKNDEQSHDGETQFPPADDDNFHISEHSANAEEEEEEEEEEPSSMSNQQEEAVSVANVEPPVDGSDRDKDGSTTAHGSARSLLAEGMSILRGTMPADDKALLVDKLKEAQRLIEQNPASDSPLEGSRKDQGDASSPHQDTSQAKGPDDNDSREEEHIDTSIAQASNVAPRRESPALANNRKTSIRRRSTQMPKLFVDGKPFLKPRPPLPWEKPVYFETSSSSGSECEEISNAGSSSASEVKDSPCLPESRPLEDSSQAKASMGEEHADASTVQASNIAPRRESRTPVSTRKNPARRRHRTQMPKLFVDGKPFLKPRPPRPWEKEVTFDTSSSEGWSSSDADEEEDEVPAGNGEAPVPSIVTVSTDPASESAKQDKDRR